MLFLSHYEIPIPTSYVIPAQASANSSVWVISLKQWQKSSDDSLSDMPVPRQKLGKLADEVPKVSGSAMYKLSLWNRYKHFLLKNISSQLNRRDRGLAEAIPLLSKCCIFRSSLRYEGFPVFDLEMQ